jgi:predicted N-acetyltransferase YhbS
MQGEDAAGLLSPECIREGITQCCYILTVAVHETHRRQGLATRLLHACIDYAKRDKQCGVVYLHVITNNAPALAFYQRNGFAHVKTCYNFYRIDGCNYNAFLYALYLPPAQPTATVAKRLRVSGVCLSHLLCLNWCKVLLACQLATTRTKALMLLTRCCS